MSVSTGNQRLAERARAVVTLSTSDRALLSPRGRGGCLGGAAFLLGVVSTLVLPSDVVVKFQRICVPSRV